MTLYKLYEDLHDINLSNTSSSREITVYVFKYGDGADFWAAILDLNVKMVSERSKNLFNGPWMPNLVGKIASFAFFLTHLVQEISL